MFSTLKYRLTENDTKLVDVRHSTKPRTRNQHLACKQCHSKKVKCSGQRDGCDRCRAKSMQCVYLRSTKPEVNGLGNGTATETRQKLSNGQHSQTSVSGGSATQNSRWLAIAESEQLPELPWSMTTENLGQESLDEKYSCHDNGDATWDMGLNMIAADNMEPLSFSLGNGLVSELQEPLNPESNPASGAAKATLGPEDFQDFGYDPMTLCGSLTASKDWTVSSHVEDRGRGRDKSKFPIPADGYGNGFHQTVEPSRVSTSLSPTTSLPSLTSSLPCTCQCTHDAVRILEVLQVTNNIINPTTGDRVLSLKKTAIDQCITMMNCPICSTTSAFVMLLIVICEKLVMSFESWSSNDKGKFLLVQQKCREDDESSRTSQSSNMMLGAYEADLESEKYSIFRALAMCQLRRLTGLLSSLMDISASKDWGTHLNLLNSFQSRVRKSAEILAARF